MAAINHCRFMANLPIGFVFAPSDDEIIGSFLKKLVTEGPRSEHPLGCHIHYIDVYGFHPPSEIAASLPEAQRYDFYVFTKTKKLTPGRNKRTTDDGMNTWKGMSGAIDVTSRRDGHVVVGEKKSFSFLIGVNKETSHWTMYEYDVKMIDGVPVAADVDGRRWVICHLVFNKNYVKKKGVVIGSGGGGVVIQESAAVLSSKKKRKIPGRPECSNMASVDAGGIQQQQLSLASTSQPTATLAGHDGGIQQQQLSFATTCQPTATMAIMQQQQQQQQQEFFGAAHPTALHGAEAYSWNAFDHTNVNGGMLLQQQQQQLYIGADQPTTSATTEEAKNEEMVPPPESSQSSSTDDSEFDLVQYLDSVVETVEMQPTEEAQELLPQSSSDDDPNFDWLRLLESSVDVELESTSTGIGVEGEDGQNHHQMLENGSAEVNEQQAAIGQWPSEFQQLSMNDDQVGVPVPEQGWMEQQ